MVEPQEFPGVEGLGTAALGKLGGTHTHIDREGLKNILPGLEGMRSIAEF